MYPRVLIVDDDSASLQMSQKAMEALIPAENISCASTAAETIALLGEKQIDLAFLDIDMPDTSGFSIAEYLGKNCPQIKFVFLTGYVDFAARSYDYEPLDFLTKPIDLMRLRKTLERYELRSQPSAPVPSCERIAIDTNDGFTLVYPSEIAYIGKEHRVLTLHCLNGSQFAVRHSLDELESIFSDFGFFRIHQSYLVPLNNIVSVRPTRFGRTYEAVLGDEICLPVSRDKYQKLRSFLTSRGVQFI